MTFVMTRTPYRISFFGGGSDYPTWYLKRGGAVLSTTVNKYCYITVRHLPRIGGNVHRVVWRHVESVDTVHDILHPAVREGLKFLGYDDSIGLEVHYQGDLPARAGMGSSSSFAVGLINALRALRGETPSKSKLLEDAIYLERELLKDNVGSQDQTAAAYGGLNHIVFNTDGSIAVNPLSLEPGVIDRLNEHLLLFFTGRQRTASSVADSVIRGLGNREEQVSRLQRMVDDGVAFLKSGDIESFGNLLHDAWTIKKSISDQVSSEFVDRVYKVARANGVLGGKLLGAGQAGFMCFIVEPAKREQVIKSLSDMGTFVPVKLSDSFSEVVYSLHESSS